MPSALDIESALDEFEAAGALLHDAGRSITKANIGWALSSIGARARSGSALLGHGIQWSEIRDFIEGRGPRPGGHGESATGPASPPPPRDIPMRPPPFGVPRAVAALRAGKAVPELDGHETLTTAGGWDLDELGPQLFERLRKGAARRQVAHHIASNRSFRADDTHSCAAVLMMGDVHFGSTGVDYDRLLWIAEILEAGLPLYVIQIGDFFDQMLWSIMRQDLEEQDDTLRGQVACGAWYLRKIAPHVAGLVAGNHDLWAKRLVGMSPLDTALQGLGDIPYHEEELKLNFEIGEQSYRFCLRHAVRGHSMWNPGHGVGRWGVMNDRDGTDVLVAGHTHRSGYQWRRLGERLFHGVQLGAYKMSSGDSYGTIKGFPDENVYPDMLAILERDEHKVTIVPDTEFGLDHLRLRVGR